MEPAPEVRLIRDEAEYLAALQVRIRVFVTEQGGPLSEEPDRWDREARQFVVMSEEGVVGTARVYHPEPAVTKLGRICLLPEYRGRGWGALLLRALLDYSMTLGPRCILLDAQTYALPFYERFGFRPLGEVFFDAGLPHRRMERTLP
jgi:predicted GNAT family N-acyltransferase